jgi:hypothetical protein
MKVVEESLRESEKTTTAQILQSQEMLKVQRIKEAEARRSAIGGVTR